MENPIHHIDDSDRIWLYQANRHLTDEEVAKIRQSGEHFIAQWAAHGAKLHAEVMVLHKLFVVIALNEQMAQATGCSIDKSVKWITALGEELGIDFLNRTLVAWIDADEQIQIHPMNEFGSLAKQGVIVPDTRVFNNLVYTGAELKQKWITPARLGWQKRFLPNEMKAL